MRIKVLMDGGEEPRVSITSEADYFHFDRDESVTVPTTIEAELSDEHRARLVEVLTDIGEANAAGARRAAMRSAAIVGGRSARTGAD